MDKKSFWTLVICFHALFFCKQVFFKNSLLQDSKEYIFAAENIIQHKTLYAWDLQDNYNKNWLTKRPFLYPAILVVTKLLSFGSDKLFFVLTYLLQNIVSLFCISLALRLVNIKIGQVNYKYAAIFLFFSLAQAIYTNMVMSEIWIQLCMVSIIYILMLRPLNTRNILFVGLLLVAGMSLKPVLMFTAFCYPLYYLLVSYKSIRIKHLLLTLLPLCFYLSICKINEKRTGYFHYSSISNINLLHYNTYSMLLNKYGMEKADSMVDQINAEARTKGDYPEQQTYIRKACADKIGEHLTLYGWLHARGAILCLVDPGRFDLTQFFGLPHKTNLIYETNKEGGFNRILKSFLNPLGIILTILLLFNLFKIYVFVRFLISKTIAIKLKLAILFFPFYILFFTGPIGTSRFYMPLIPFVLIMFLMSHKGQAKKTEKIS
jgi:hypothetical protein